MKGAPTIWRRTSLTLIECPLIAAVQTCPSYLFVHIDFIDLFPTYDGGSHSVKYVAIFCHSFATRSHLIASNLRWGRSKNQPVVARSTQLLVISWRMSFSRCINFAPYDSTGQILTPRRASSVWILRSPHRGFFRAIRRRSVPSR